MLYRRAQRPDRPRGNERGDNGQPSRCLRPWCASGKSACYENQRVIERPPPPGVTTRTPRGKAIGALAPATRLTIRKR